MPISSGERPQWASCARPAAVERYLASTPENRPYWLPPGKRAAVATVGLRKAPYVRKYTPSRSGTDTAGLSTFPYTERHLLMSPSWLTLPAEKRKSRWSPSADRSRSSSVSVSFERDISWKQRDVTRAPKTPSAPSQASMLVAMASYMSALIATAPGVAAEAPPS